MATPRPLDELIVILLNARSIVNKSDSLELLLLNYELHSVVITETWLSDSISDVEVVPHGYQIYRRGGGVTVIAEKKKR